jgi:glutaredoxin
MAKVASLHRMVTDEHVCPFGPKTKALLERQGFTVDDHVLRSREEVEAFKAEQHVDTTPQTFIDGRRIGGHDETRACLGVAVPKDDQTTYQPVLAVVAA